MTEQENKRFEDQLRQIMNMNITHLNFSKFEYKNTKTNGIVICIKHKCKFSQNFNNLKKGYGCPTCNEERKKETKAARKEKRRIKVERLTNLLMQSINEDEDMRKSFEALAKN